METPDSEALFEDERESAQQASVGSVGGSSMDSSLQPPMQPPFEPRI